MSQRLLPEGMTLTLFKVQMQRSWNASWTISAQFTMGYDAAPSLAATEAIQMEVDPRLIELLIHDLESKYVSQVDARILEAAQGAYGNQPSTTIEELQNERNS